MRWTFMPLKVFISPMKFYSKQGQDYKYKSMVVRALNEWQNSTKGKIRFKVVNTLLESNINIEWKRVERKALGHCYFNYDASNRLYSAEVAIGLTEGLVHADYMNENEVYHTILHEIGHAIGLGHSPNPSDIMYTPHQKGVNSISQGDRLTVNWLYTLPQGATTKDVSLKYSIGGSNIDDIISQFIDKKSPSEFEKVKSSIKVKKRDLLEEQEMIANLHKYHMSLQNVNLSPDLKKFIQERKHQ